MEPRVHRDEIVPELSLRSEHCFARLERNAPELGFQPLDVRLQREDAPDPGEADALVGQLLNPPQQHNITFGVPAATTLGARRLDQSLALVDAQRLGMHTGQICPIGRAPV